MSDRKRADAVYATLLERQGERWVQPRVERTRRVLELLADPQRTYRVVHVTGTNGKTSTSRIIESLVRAHGLRTGLFTSPHLERFTERIMIDGEPVADAAIADAWDEISPFVDLVDAELKAAGDAPLTFFELLTVLAFVACADAPVDVLVLEVGMGGSWDSTNTADGDVAVFAPIDIDHADRLGETIAEIASVKAGIIKDGAAVVSAKQDAAAEAVLRAAAAARDASIAFEGAEFALTEDRLAVGGQLISVRGIAGEYREEYLPLYGAHQGANAALAIAAVESLIGGGRQPIAGDILAEGLSEVLSPGRLQLVGDRPDGAGGCRAQPARRPRARLRADGVVRLRRVGCRARRAGRQGCRGHRGRPRAARRARLRDGPGLGPRERRGRHRRPRRVPRARRRPCTRTSPTPPRRRASGPRHPIAAPSSSPARSCSREKPSPSPPPRSWKAGWDA